MSEKKTDEPKKEKDQGTNLPKYFVSGGFGGVCTVVSGHPFDTIKVRLQTMPSPAPGQKPLYAGTFDCMKQTFVKEGPKGFYKGMSAPLVGVAPIFAISFFGYGIGKKLQQKDTSVPLEPYQLFLAGAFSGIFTTAIMAPGERIKCLLQVQQGGTQPPLYNGPVDCVKKLYKQGGLKSIYKGTCATLLRDVPASGMYFFSYELIQRALMKPGDDPNSLGIGRTIIAGGCTGIAFWIVGMPADVLKSRLQTSPEGTYPNGVRDVFKQLIKQDGVTALYRGVIPVMMRAFPANAACFLGFEVAMSFLNYVFP